MDSVPFSIILLKAIIAVTRISPAKEGGIDCVLVRSYDCNWIDLLSKEEFDAANAMIVMILVHGVARNKRKYFLDTNLNIIHDSIEKVTPLKQVVAEICYSQSVARYFDLNDIHLPQQLYIQIVKGCV